MNTKVYSVESVGVREDKEELNMSVYPFYTKVESSTRKTATGVGARSKNGVLNTHIYQRKCGEITNPVTINQFTEERNGVLKCITRVFYQGELLKEHITDY